MPDPRTDGETLVYILGHALELVHRHGADAARDALSEAEGRASNDFDRAFWAGVSHAILLAADAQQGAGQSLTHRDGRGGVVTLSWPVGEQPSGHYAGAIRGLITGILGRLTEDVTLPLAAAEPRRWRLSVLTDAPMSQHGTEVVSIELRDGTETNRVAAWLRNLWPEPDASA